MNQRALETVATCGRLSPLPPPFSSLKEELAGAAQPSGFLARCPEYRESPALLPSFPIPTSRQPRRSLTWAGPARRAGDKWPGRHPLLCRAYLTPHPKTGTRKEQLKSQVQHGNQEECNGSGSCLVAESLAGCCYKASPCATMIKGEKRGGGRESKKEKEKKKRKIILNAGKPVIGLEDWLFCFAWLLFFFCCNHAA